MTHHEELLRSLHIMPLMMKGFEPSTYSKAISYPNSSKVAHPIARRDG